MGIFIHLEISKSITRKEWADVYEETLQLVKAFPLAERREVLVRGIPTKCLVPTEEHDEASSWWIRKRVRTGWFADGDYEYLRTAECYFLPRDLVTEDQYEGDAPDAIFASIPRYVKGKTWNDERFNHNYSLWGMKTQGEPYHMYLLSIACLIESRLGKKAYVYGDITKGQCERAVRMANSHLERAIHTPDQCDKDRLLARIEELSLTETEKLQLFTGLYLGRRDAAFGECIRNHYSEQVCNEYWKSRFNTYPIMTRGFDEALEDYLFWGFEFEGMLSYISYFDNEGNAHFEDFVNRIMDAKLHRPNKDCTDVLQINPDEETPYGIGVQFAQFLLGEARNKRIDRYIPIEDIRTTLSRAIGNHCPVNKLIDEYLQRESVQELPDLSSERTEEDWQKAVEQDPSYVLSETMRAKERAFRETRELFDVSMPEELPYYEAGDTVLPELENAVAEYFAFYRSVVAENKYLELMEKSPEERCQWLARENRNLLLRDKDWAKIYADIAECPESFSRYYPMVRVKVNSEGLSSLIRALVVNDALYGYASKLTIDQSKRGE